MNKSTWNFMEGPPNRFRLKQNKITLLSKEKGLYIAQEQSFHYTNMATYNIQYYYSVLKNYPFAPFSQAFRSRLQSRRNSNGKNLDSHTRPISRTLHSTLYTPLNPPSPCLPDRRHHHPPSSSQEDAIVQKSNMKNSAKREKN